MAQTAVQVRRAQSTRKRTTRRRAIRPVRRAASPPAHVQAVLDRLGRAISVGDLPGVAACFAYPSLLLTGSDLHEFRDPQQAQEAYRRTLDAHDARGIVTIHPDLDDVTSLGSGIHEVSARWEAYDGRNELVASERAHYVIQETAAGTALIRVGIALGPESS